VVRIVAAIGVTAGTLWAGSPAAAANRAHPGNPYNLAVVGNTLFFTAWDDDGSKDVVLWKSDGTKSGTRVVKDVNGPGTGSCCSQLTSAGDYLIFDGYEAGFKNTEVWVSDGTPAGTRMLKDINPGERGSDAGCCIDRGFTTIGETTFFQAYDDERGLSLWKTDGTTDGTVLVRDFQRAPNSVADGELGSFLDIGGTLYFSAPSERQRSSALWKSDGTAEGTVEIAAQDTPWDPEGLTPSGDDLYFVADRYSDPYAFEVWKSDGTTAGTRQVGTERFTQLSLDAAAYKGEFYFGGEPDPPGIPRLWKTQDGGQILTPVRAPKLAKWNFPGEMITFKDKLYFVARDTEQHRELWSTDGTSEGTKRVKNINRGAGYDISNLTIAGDKMFFTVGDRSGRQALWKTDGTGKGTRLVKAAKTWTKVCCDFVATDSRLYFVAQREGWNAPSLWTSDGTTKGTRSLRRTSR